MSFLSQPLEFFSISPRRSFAGISGYTTVSDQAADDLVITEQPVQQGASIADHAFKKPVKYSINMLFRDNQDGKSLSEIYGQLLDLQSKLETFDVITPKRTYYNMLLESLSQTTDKKTENCLSIAAVFKEVIIVPVTTTIIPRDQLRNAANNGATQKAGRKSALLTLTQGIGQAFQ